MTNYIASMVAVVALLTGACHAADTPATPKPAAAKPAPAAAAPAAAPASVAALPRWTQAPGSSLTFTFDQAGAATSGSFTKFSTALAYDDKSPASGTLNVKVQIASVDAQDKERNDLLVGADLLDAQKYPTAQYTGTLARSGAGLEAVGKLTLRGVTHDLRLPLKIVPTTAGLELSGTTSIKRLDYGVGQGDFKSTEEVGNEVKIQYKVALVKAK